MPVNNIWLKLGRIAVLPFCAVRDDWRQTGRETSFAKRLWWLAIVVIGLLKLWAVAGDEIMVQGQDPTSYAWSTTGIVWGRAGDVLPSHPPGMPIIAGIIAQFGIPWRFALEVLYLTACSGLAAVIAGLLRSRILALLLFTVVAWHPWTFSGFHDFMAEPFVLVLSVGLLACFLKVLSLPSSQWRWPLFVGAGILLFFWCWSRYEEPLVYGTYALFAFLAWALTQKENHPTPLIGRLALLLTPLVITVVLGSAAMAANYSHFGVRAKAQIGMPGLMALMKALYRIKPERDIYYAPVTRQALAAACQASPTLKQFEKALLDPNAQSVQSGQKINKVPGEFGTWLNWHLALNFPSDPRKANDLMLKAADEINSALKSGQLPVRSAHFPVDPNWRLWGPHLFAGVKEALRQGTSLKPWTNSPTRSPSTWYEMVFDEAATRRRTTASTHLVLGEGWITAPASALDSAVLKDERGTIINAFPLATNKDGTVQTFQFRIAWTDMPPKSYGLEFFRKGERRFACECQFDPATPWRAQKAATTGVLADGGEPITYSYQFMTSGFQNKVERFAAIEGYATKYFKQIFRLTLILAVPLLFFGRPWERTRIRQLFAAALLVAGWFFARTALYGWMIAMVGWGSERYMRCVSPVFILLLLLGAALVVAIFQRQWRRFGVATTSHQKS